MHPILEFIQGLVMGAFSFWLSVGLLVFINKASSSAESEPLTEEEEAECQRTRKEAWKSPMMWILAALFWPVHYADILADRWRGQRVVKKQPPRSESEGA